MGPDTWSWIVPDGLWGIAKPLILPSRVRPQGGGTQDTPDETVFAAITYVLVSGCAWRALPPCFGISKSTAHRGFCSGRGPGCGAGCTRRSCTAWTMLACSTCPMSCSTPPTSGLKRGEHTGPSPVDRGKPGTKMYTSSEENGLPLLVGVSAANVHDSLTLKPMVEGHHTRHDPHHGRYFKPSVSTRTRHMTGLTYPNGFVGNGSESGSLQRHRVQPAVRATPLGHRTHHVLAVRLPPPQPSTDASFASLLKAQP